MQKLSRDFYCRDTLEVAKAVLGKVLVRRTSSGIISGRIVETEAYVQGDAASHTTRGITNRTRVMFGEPGHVYVYLIYGFHYCINLVSHPEGLAGGVMIRALEPLQGIELMKTKRGKENVYDLASGPGKLTQAMDIDRSLYGEDLLSDHIYVLDDQTDVGEIIARPRIGIKLAMDKLWRFYPLGWKEWVSKP